MTTIEKATCKTCGFYENNCPFIRGKFIPYPNKVCEDYTFSTLKAEQEPVSEELEEELDRFIASGKSVTVDDYGTYKVSYHDFKKVARHFAVWGAEHSGSLETPNDLEEAAEKYSDKYCSDWAYRLEYEDAFIAGAKWRYQKDRYEFAKLSQEVDLEKEFKEYVDDDPVYSKLVNHFAGMSIARHFYELGKNSK